MFNFRGRLFWHIFHSVDSLLEKWKVTNIFRYLKVSDIESDFIYGGDLLSFISSLKVYKLSALDKEDKVFRMALYRKICPSVSLNIIKTICTKLIKKFGFINFWRVFWVKTMKGKSSSPEIFAYWVTDQNNIGHSSLDRRPWRVNFYFFIQIW